MARYTYTVRRLGSEKSEQECITVTDDNADVYDMIMQNMLAQVRFERMHKLLKDYDGDMLDFDRLCNFVPHPFKNYIPNQRMLTQAYMNTPEALVGAFKDLMTPQIMLREFMLSLGSMWEIQKQYKISNIQKTESLTCECPHAHA